MALVVVSRSMDPESFASGLKQLDGGLDVRVWPEAGDMRDIRYALVWKPEDGVLASFPSLEVIFSMGAGVDHVLSDTRLPDVPLVRFVDPNLTMRMTEYVCLHVLLHHRRMLDYAELPREKRWKDWSQQPGANEVRVGILGLGVLGRDAAEKLAMLGYQVAGWSRSQKNIGGIECFAGDDGLQPFLAQTDVLVCLLPHTPDTDGFLSAGLFSSLARDGSLPGPVLINAGRGRVQVEADILAALEDGTLWEASLDVFEEEPLPTSSPLWSHPKVIVTPHNASISDDRAVCQYVIDQIARHEAGEPLQNVVDLKRGY